MSLNHELAEMFAKMAAIMEIRGENPFKAIAFSKISRILKDMAIDIRRSCEEGRLRDIEGIGEHSCRIIEEYVRTGRSSDYDELVTSVPVGLLPMLGVPGLGPKTIALLWKQRNITSLDELLAAIESGGLAGIKGLGEKKIVAIRAGIAFRETAAKRLGIGEALPVAVTLRDRLREMKQVKQAEIAGSLRRRRETIGDVDLVCALKDDQAGGEVSRQFVEFPEVSRVLGQGETKASIVTASGLQVDLRMVPADSFGAALLYFTGSKDHNVKIRGRAQSEGMTLNEWGLFTLGRGKKASPARDKPVAGKSEQEIYSKLGMQYVEPELREDRGEVEAALEKRLPKLVERGDIRGDLHTHTTASDGVATIEEMAEAATLLGYEYLAITDHSKSQVIANGLTADRLMKHVAAIRKVSERLRGITLLAGIEVDILVDGRLDFDDAVLAELDFVVASPHVSLQQPAEKANARLLRAIENPYVNVIGHPTGRIINAREGLPLDIARLTSAAAASGTALEINAGYPRLDLNDIHARAAIEGGAMLSLNTDAHSTPEFDNITWGLGVARRAWATKRHIINCLPLKDLRTFIRRKRPR